MPAFGEGRGQAPEFTHLKDDTMAVYSYPCETLRESSGHAKLHKNCAV